jgi:hypothetical protein
MAALYATLCIGAAFVGGATLLAAHAQQTGSKTPEPKCKISPIQAIKVVTDKVPGRALNANFELDEDKWVYTVLVVSGKTLKEVQVDPMTGKAGDAETVTPEEKAKDIREDLTKAVGGEAPAEPESNKKDAKPEKP